MAGELYIVATPIGNLGDMVPRGVEVLQSADLVAAEDTRHSRRLLDHFNIDKPLVTYHDHSGGAKVDSLLQALQNGQTVALVSDAGTPLISDPGYRIVHQARQQGIAVHPIPGPCAAVAALSAAGLPTNRFTFEGFLPAKQAGRVKSLELLVKESRTMVFYEAPHRVLDTLQDMKAVFGADREVVLARELTKAFETILSAPLEELVEVVAADSNQQRGEIVLLVSGVDEQQEEAGHSEQERVLRLLLDELSVKQASTLAAKITGGHKKTLYKLAVEIKDAASD
ncbi:16S rRNA (cytidine(1402)-2'-O)-methyltransferase [bacterium SCSIO 12696]|nr:16S rRNA (cytidine(1402)-2'-O)-methyltransferase [bacterium SCSIO 12696]